MTQNTFNQPKKTKILKKLKRKLKKAIAKINTPRGWALIAAVFFFFILSTAAISNMVVSNTVMLNNTVFEANLGVAENMGLNTASPIRQYIVDEMYYRIQQQLIEHMNKAGGSSGYICQDALVPPTSADPIGGSLNNQFGLCDPVNMFGGMLGDTNQTIDYLQLYPEHNKTLDDKITDNVRKSIVSQFANKYDYTLRTTYIGQELVQPAVPGLYRTEKYLWSVRADVETQTVGGIKNGMVLYYDVTLTNMFFPTDFPGAGSACDQTETTYQCGRQGDDGCGPVIIGLIGPDGKPQPVLEIDPDAPEYQPGDGIPCRDTPNARYCSILGGGTSVTLFGTGIRSQLGCASPRTGVKGATGVDPFGYNFSLAVRLVSIGSTYN